MIIHDISAIISPEMTVYKNKQEKRPKINVVQNFSQSDSYESRIDIDLHTGTHMDMPLHMIEGGHTVEQLDLSKVVRKCKVLDFTNVENSITKADLEKKDIQKEDFLLFKTRNSCIEEFDYNFVYLEKSGAEYLENLRITGVGIDALGIERNQPKHETHKILLGAGILILEGLRLKDVDVGEYLLCAAPILIKGVEAAPVRALLIEMNHTVC